MVAESDSSCKWVFLYARNVITVGTVNQNIASRRKNIYHVLWEFTTQQKHIARIFYELYARWRKDISRKEIIKFGCQMRQTWEMNKMSCARLNGMTIAGFIQF